MTDDPDFQDIIDWAYRVLDTDAAEIAAEVIVKTPWSCVIRIEAPAGVFYLKKTPPDLWIEAAVTRFCTETLALDCTPRLRAADKTLGCFLMESCGDVTLRTHFAGHADMDLLCRGIGSFRQLATAAAPHTESLLQMGVPDWRLSTLPAVFSRRVANAGFLRAQGYSAAAAEKFSACLLRLRADCAELAAGGIAETLCHCDFHDNNITVDLRTRRTAVIDLGETVLSHPFLPLLSLERRLAGRYGLADGDARLPALHHACYDGWGIAGDDLRRLRVVADRLAAVFFTLSYIRLAAATTPDTTEKAAIVSARIRAGLDEVLSLFS